MADPRFKVLQGYTAGAQQGALHPVERWMRDPKNNPLWGSLEEADAADQRLLKMTDASRGEYLNGRIKGFTPELPAIEPTPAASRITGTASALTPALQAAGTGLTIGGLLAALGDLASEYYQEQGVKNSGNYADPEDYLHKKKQAGIRAYFPDAPVDPNETY